MGVTNLKKLLEDERTWTVTARVAKFTDQASHFETNEEGDVIVSCLTLLHEVPIWANLDSLAGGSDGSGVWFVPDPGTEVMIAFDHGDFEGEAHIVSRTSGGIAPQGLGPGIVFVLGTDVQVRSPAGVALKMPKLADVQALADKLTDFIVNYNSHTHLYIPGSNPTVTTTGLSPSESSPAPSPVGTTVLKAE